MPFFWSGIPIPTPAEIAAESSQAPTRELTYQLTEEGTHLWMSYRLHREWLTKVAIEEYSQKYGTDRTFSILDYQGNILTTARTKQISNGP